MASCGEGAWRDVSESGWTRVAVRKNLMGRPGVAIALALTMLASALVVLQPARAQSPGGSTFGQGVSSPGLSFENVAEAQQPGGEEYVPGEILVGIHPASARGAEAAMEGLGASLIDRFPRVGVERWKLPQALPTMAAVSLLSADSNVRYAEPNYIRTADAIPDDALRNELWGMHNIGQTGGAVDADVDALDAWGFQTGSSTVVVGVIDSGVDYTHPDLAANIWINPGEDLDHDGIVDSDDFNGLDDDLNGYVDDLRGWDCRNNDNDPFDDNSHGTHVAGTIGAVGNNGIGVAGVTWQVKIMPLKFLSAYGSGSTADAIECINYAASFVDDSGNKVVRITSNSYGGGPASTAEQDAIAASGALFVASAGNSGSTKKGYPAGYPLNNIIAVAATDQTDALWSSSNRGSWVHLAAPGVNIVSAIPLWHEPIGYGWMSGTSMAAPHVSGAAALVMSQYPSDTILQVKDRILNNVDVLPSLQRKVLTNGRLNVVKALGFTPPADTTPPEAVTDVAVGFVAHNAVTLTWTATGDDGTVGMAYLYDVRYRTDGPVTDANWASSIQATREPLPRIAGTSEAFAVGGLLPETTYYFALKAVDDAALPSTLSNGVTATTTPVPPGGWALEVVDSAGDVGNWMSMVTDAAGNPHVSYTDFTTNSIKYARRTGSSWETERVASSSRWTSIAVDTSGTVHIVYFDENGKDLNHAWKVTGGTWSIEMVDTGSVKGYGKSSAGNWNSITVDAAGNPHVAYRDGYDNTPGSLKYAYKSGGQWTIQVVDDGDRAALGGTSIALDSLGYPHIAYHDSACSCLRYARWTGSQWLLEVIEDPAGSDAGGFTQPRALAIDPSDNPCVSYSGPQGLMYARRTSGWSVQVVDPMGSGDNNLVLDASGNPHISYFYDTTSDVRHAWWDGTAWVIETVDGEYGSVGWWASIALGSGGKPMIAYMEIDNRDLKFARMV